MFKHIIDTEVELRLINPRDNVEIFELIKENRTYLEEWFTWVNRVKVLGDTNDFIKGALNQFANNNGFQAAIIYGGKIVGIIGLHALSWDNKCTSIGYWLAESYQGKGIVTRACKAVIDYIFNDLVLERIEIRCAVKNLKSQAIPERLGFTKEGVCRKAENLHGVFVDHIVYSILREEWES